MSYQRASKDSHNDQTLTSLVLIAGRDCRPDLPLRAQGPDLWVRGGAIVEKTMCVLGNLSVDGMMSGNLCGDLFTDRIVAKELQDGITVIGDLFVDPDFVLQVDEVKANCLTGVEGAPITFKSGLELSKQNLGNVGNISVCGTASFDGNVNINGGISTGPLECIESISSKTDLLICADGDIEIKPAGGNLILHNTGIAFDIYQNILANIMCVQAGPGVALELKTDPGFKVEISGGDGLDMMGRDICNVGSITSSTGNVVIPPSQTLDVTTIDAQCGIVANVGVLVVSNIFGKSPITINDDLELKGTSNINNAATVGAADVNTGTLNGAALGDLSGVTAEQIIAYDTTGSEFLPKTLVGGTNISIVPSAGALTINNTLSIPPIPVFSVSTGSFAVNAGNPAPGLNPIVTAIYTVFSYVSGGTRVAWINVDESTLRPDATWNAGSQTELTTAANAFGGANNPSGTRYGFCSWNPAWTGTVGPWGGSTGQNYGATIVFETNGTLRFRAWDTDFTATAGFSFALSGWTLGPYITV